MKRCDLLVTGGDLLDLTTPGSSLDDHGVAIIGDRIAEVAPRSEMVRQWDALRSIDATGCVVTPGFIDAHVHLTAFLMTPLQYERASGPSLFGGGAPPAVLMAMVAQMTSMPVPAEATCALLRPVFAALLASGITSVVDAGGSGLDGIVQAATETGIRLATGPSLADLWHDDGVFDRRADVDQLLATAADFIAAHDGSANGRVRALVSAVEATACSDELLSGIATLAAESDVPTHVHCLIDEEADALHEELHGALPIDRLAATGLLSTRCTAMHVGHADDHAVEVLANAGATVNHNPLGNMMLGWNTMRHRALPKLLTAGVPLVLGSDYSPSMIASPFDLMHAALMAHREVAARDDALLLEDAVAMATNSGVAMGRPGQLGAIRTGQLADLVVLDTSGPHHLGSRHPIPSVALRGRPGDVRTVIVDGTVVVDERAVTTVDVERATREALEVLRSMQE